MDRETLLRYFEHNYISKRAVLPWLPLGMNPDAIWEELQKRRKAKCTMLPIHGSGGEPCWYVTTESMIAASERVVEEFMAYQPSMETPALAPPEENLYTSLLEGLEVNPEDALQYIMSGSEPASPEEQILHNNRYALAFAEMNLYHPLDSRFIRTLAEIVTTNMENGGGQFRQTDSIRVESMGDEAYTVLPARYVPDYLGEISAYLADPSVHPMIKAGIIQAWVLMVRPFAEGNERIARVLSLVVLHRAGYSFFSDVSFSSLIAANGYAYYEAVNSLLRRENNGDMTYFLDYFLQLLAHAAEEHRRKMEEQTSKTLSAERQMAGTVLAPSDTAPDPNEEEIPEIDISEFTFLSSGDPSSDESLDAYEKTDNLENAAGVNSGQGNEGEWVGESRVKAKLEEVTTSRSKDYQGLLFQYLKSGKYTFTSRDVFETLGKSSNTVTAFLKKLCDEKILEVTKGKPGAIMEYCFSSGDEPFTETDYSEEVISLLTYLSKNHRSQKDARIGRAILQCGPLGYITEEKYREFNEMDKWQSDMEFAEQIGLVRKVDSSRYFLMKVIHYRYDLLNDTQRKKATEMYNSFGNDFFSTKMLVATLSYTENVAKAVLHTFRLLRILDCHKDGVNMYQFRVNPEENPECFESVA